MDGVKIACSQCGATASRIPDVGNPWLDAGIVAYSTMCYRTDRAYWEKWFPADFITESFPGQFRNWFYSLLAMSTVLERRPPTRTVFGFGTLLAEDGTQMHKSAGNMIEFNEAADRIGAVIVGAPAAADRRVVPCRFSAGYGDWSLQDQPRLFALLPHAQLGVSLLPSMMMVPRKSVSFAMWLGAAEGRAAGRGCARCPLDTCRYRRKPRRPASKETR